MPGKAKHGRPAEDLARLAGVALSTWRKHRREGAPTPATDADSDVEGWLKAYHEWRGARRRKPGFEPREPSAEETDWSARSTRALAELREWDLAVKRGDYVRRELVDDQRARQVTAVRQALYALIPKLGRQLFQAPTVDWIEERIEAEFDRLLDHFAGATDG